MLWNEIRSNVPILEVRLIQQFIQEVYVRLYSFDCDFPKGADHFPDGTVTVFVIDDDLGDHGIIVWRDCVVIVDCRVHADSISAGQMQVCDPARAWHEMSLRVFCVDPAFHGVAADFYIFLLNA